MKIGLYSLMLFFICLNLSVYLMNESQLLGDFYIPPYEEPSNILSRLLTLNITGTDLLFGGTTIAVGFIVSWISGKFIYGGTLALILFAIDLFVPMAKWILFGFPTFLNQIAEVETGAAGSLAAISLVIQVLMSLVWFWLILGFIGQRQLEQ